VIPKHNFIAWCRRLRDDLKRQLDALESGTLCQRKRDGGKWVDTTPQAIERTKTQLAEIDGLLIGAEKTQPAEADAPSRTTVSLEPTSRFGIGETNSTE
jgi:hypothetical protein